MPPPKTQKTLPDYSMLNLKEDIEKMMSDTREELKAQIDGIRDDLADIKREFRRDLQMLSDRVDEDLKNAKEETTKEVEELRKEIERMAYHDRKYNLILHGCQVKSGEENKVLETFCEKMKISTSAKADIVNIHPIGPERVIVRFLRWSDRQKILTNAKNLKGTKLGIQTDLPPTMRKKRAELVNMCKTLREDGTHARVAERAGEVYIQVRGGPREQWRRHSNRE